MMGRSTMAALFRGCVPHTPHGGNQPARQHIIPAPCFGGVFAVAHRKANDEQPCGPRSPAIAHDMRELLAHLAGGWTPGAIGVWTLVAGVIGLWWKGLPAIIDAFERKQSGVESRIAGLLDAQAKRFNEQLEQADDRHDECMEGQRQLRIEMAALRRENSDLWGTINAMRQGALSVETVVAKTILETRK